MRPILIGDVLACARALQGYPHHKRSDLCDEWLTQAHYADKYRKRFQRQHPHWGNGSLMARACAETAFALGQTPLHEAEFRACLALVLTALNHRAAQPQNENTVPIGANLQECDP